MKKQVYIIEWFEAYQDEDSSGNLKWYDSYSKRHTEVFFDEMRFVTRLRTLQDMHYSLEYVDPEYETTVGTINQYKGFVKNSIY